MRNFKFFICLLLIFSFIFFTFSACFAEDTVYVWSSTSNTLNTQNDTNNTNTTNTATDNNTTSTSSPNIETTENTDSLNLEAESAILIEQSTG